LNESAKVKKLFDMQSRSFGFLFAGFPSPQPAKTDVIWTIVKP
jgi:hypothetical protein